MTEREVTRDFLVYARMRGAVPYRRNVGLVKYVDQLGKERYVRFNEKGQSDWWLILPNGSGRHVEAEMKSSEGWPTENQIQWMRSVNMQGGAAFWIPSIHTLMRVFDHLMVGGSIDMDIRGQYRLIGGGR